MTDIQPCDQQLPDDNQENQDDQTSYSDNQTSGQNGQKSSSDNQPPDNKKKEEGTTDRTSQINVQIIDVNKTEACVMFVEALKTIIENNKDGTKLYRVIDNHDEEDAEARLLVICPTLFEIENAISPVKRKNNYAVVIFHTLKDDKLPVIPPGQTLKGHHDKIRFIDVAFGTGQSKQKGIYSNTMNTKAEEQIFDYLHNFEVPCVQKKDGNPVNPEDPKHQKLDTNDITSNVDNTTSNHKEIKIRKNVQRSGQIQNNYLLGISWRSLLINRLRVLLGNGQRFENKVQQESSFACIKVQIMDVNKTKTCGMVFEDLKAIIENNKDGTKLCKVIDKDDEEDPEARLLVLCPTLFRLKSDFDNAISSVKRKNDYAVIIIHTVKEDNLPVIPSQQKLQGYNNITIIDMGFNTEIRKRILRKSCRIYKCDTNDEAKKQLFRYIRNFEDASASKPDDDPEKPEEFE